jgi:hypothetical protein
MPERLFSPARLAACTATITTIAARNTDFTLPLRSAQNIGGSGSNIYTHILMRE